MPESGSASRIGFGSQVDDSVREVRVWFATRGRDRFVWSLGPSTTPTDMERRLLDPGAAPNPTASELTAMVLDLEPRGSPAGVVLRPVEVGGEAAARV